MKSVKLLGFALAILVTNALYSSQTVCSVPVLDSIPLLKIFHKESIDTVSIYDYDTNLEEVSIVKNNFPFVEVCDSIVTFDSETYTERIKITKTELSLKDYYSNDGKYRLEQIKDHVRLINKNNTIPTDTITVFDSETFEETDNFIKRVNPCYYFGWGSYNFSHLHTLTPEDFVKLFGKKIRLFNVFQNDKCQDVGSFSCRIIIVSAFGNTDVYTITNEKNFMSERLLANYTTARGIKIYVDDIVVNDEKIMDGIVLQVR